MLNRGSQGFWCLRGHILYRVGIGCRPIKDPLASFAAHMWLPPEVSQLPRCFPELGDAQLTGFAGEPYWWREVNGVAQPRPDLQRVTAAIIPGIWAISGIIIGDLPRPR